MNSIFRVSDRNSINRWFLVLTGLVFVVLRLSVSNNPVSIDEYIAPAVVSGMIQRGDLNGNWLVAVGIPDPFRVNQFNFYSYHLFSRLFHVGDTDQFILNLRWVNLGLQLATLVLLLSFVARLGLASRQKIALAALCVTAPALVFDTHIARSESFLYLLFALQLWTTQMRGNAFARYAVFGVLLGVGCASKITFILTGAILIPEIVAILLADGRKLLRQIATLLVATLVGFIVTAPYVVIDPQGFLAGVNALFTQYGTGHPPHSFLEPSLARNISRTLLFVLLTSGALLPLAVFQAFRRPVIAPGLAIFAFALIVYFATKPVFFERNIGLGLLALIIFVAANIRSRTEIVLILSSCALMLHWSFNIALIFANPNGPVTRFERATFGAIVDKAWPIEGLDEYLGSCQGTVGIRDYGDDYSSKMFADAAAKPVAHFTSVFAILPTSTLHTYLQSDLNYYRCGRQGSSLAPDPATVKTKETW